MCSPQLVSITDEHSLEQGQCIWSQLSIR